MKEAGTVPPWAIYGNASRPGLGRGGGGGGKGDSEGQQGQTTVSLCSETRKREIQVDRPIRSIRLGIFTREVEFPY